MFIILLNKIRRFSESDDDMASSLYTTPRGSLGGASLGTISSRASMQHEPVTHCPSKVGVVITSYRQSQRRYIIIFIAFCFTTK